MGGDGAPRRSVGDVGTVAGVELGLGYAVAPAVRLEALLTYQPRFTFDGHANFLAPDREQSVSVDLSSLSGILAAYVDLPGVGVRPIVWPRREPLSSAVENLQERPALVENQR